MKIRTLLLLVLTISINSACVAHPSHKHKVRAPIKAVHALEHEHHGHNIIVVNKKPAKRNCWNHQRHWHCKH